MRHAVRLAAVLLALCAGPAGAELCYDYVDFNNTAAPFLCRQQGDLTKPCTWDPFCHRSGDSGDCCTTIPSSSSQTLLHMHTAWHDCFGSTGADDGDNPPGRGGRWHAFHRQFEHDFNLWRESGHLCNPTVDDTSGCKIESLPWCKGMSMPYGHFGCGKKVGEHPDGCGVGRNRDDNVTCKDCVAFPQCLFLNGAGPAACPTPPTTTCETVGGLVTFPYTKLEQFKDVEEIADVLDGWFHGDMHGAVGVADGGGGYCSDVTNPSCSPRDPMFWRLHKALDDVVRAWQDVNATDVVVAIDRSGSMKAKDKAGKTKIEAAVEAADLFADLLDSARPDGKVNRLGVVSYSTAAADAAKNLTLTPATSLGGAGGPLETVLSAIRTGAGGCTSIGAGMEKAVSDLCGGSCAETGERKAVLLLTDGLENTPPCLRSTGSGKTCGFRCGGKQLDRATLGRTQVCAVGFGEAGSLDGELLTLFAEQQDGIYMQSPPSDPDGKWIDLKDFFAKCYGRLTDEFLGLDPKGHLPADQLASEPVFYSSCGDEKLTFVSGWKTPVPAGALRLLVTTPSGRLVRAGDPGVDASLKPTWDFARLPLPYQGEAQGTWRAHLVRPHQIFVNGFTTDAFADVRGEGVPIVRREIQRLCPAGCPRTLYFENGRRGPESAYELALAEEAASGLLGGVTRATDATKFAVLLDSDSWDLVVYAQHAGVGPQPYDELLAARLCGGQRAVLTDTRRNFAARLYVCAGVEASYPTAQAGHRASSTSLLTAVVGDGRLVDGAHSLVERGYFVPAQALSPISVASEAQAAWVGTQAAAIVARRAGDVEFPPAPQDWFVDVLVRGLSRLQPHKPVSFVKTGQGLLASVAILPSFLPHGGHDAVNARVTVEHPLVGIGALLNELGPLDGALAVGEELVTGRAAALESHQQAVGAPLFPTTTETFSLRDDGTGGDLEPGNGVWSALLPGTDEVDGMLRLHFQLALTKNGCTTTRELLQSQFVEVGVDPTASPHEVTPLPTGGARFRVFPQDRFGNPWGWGRPGTPVCGPLGTCRCGPQPIQDHGDGWYTLEVVSLRATGGTCRINAFGTTFAVPVGPAC